MSLVRKVAKAAFAALDRMHRSPQGPRILIYHQVGAGLGRQMEVTEEDFRYQLDWLSKNRQVVDLDTAIARWSDEGAEQLVVLTFDDGYRDTYTRAFPMLKELGLPFTVYLATESIDTGRSLGLSPAADPLSWSELEDMIESELVTIGSHTHTHRDLRYAAISDIERELTVSDDLIESRLGVKPRHFAYPWGYWSASADQMVRDRYLTAVLGGVVRPELVPPFHQIHRYPVQLDDGSTLFRARLEGGLLAEEKVRRVMSGYKGP